jgi:ADP-heptose:LPS heptosyltransferase
MIVTDVTKNDEPAFKKFKKELLNRKDKGEFDEVIITHIMGSNQANYDGCIRSAIFRGYHKSITVPVTPVLRLSIEEKEKANLFAQQHELNKYSQVILFEFAPQSGQSKITKDFAIELAENLTLQKNVAVILSSANKINSINKQVIDGSGLSIRETAALTHYCTFLLGCSSGITWLSTSDAAKQLPMVQLLNPETNWAILSGSPMSFS